MRFFWQGERRELVNFRNAKYLLSVVIQIIWADVLAVWPLNIEAIGANAFKISAVIQLAKPRAFYVWLYVKTLSLAVVKFQEKNIIVFRKNCGHSRSKHSASF